MAGVSGLPGLAARVTVGSRGSDPVTTQSQNMEGQTVGQHQLKLLAVVETTVVRLMYVNIHFHQICFSFGRRLGCLEDLDFLHRDMWRWHTVQEPAV